MKISKSLDYVLNKCFNKKCRSCVHLTGIPNKGKNVKLYCREKVTAFPFGRDCDKWKAEWPDGSVQNMTIGDYLEQQKGLIKK